jgi:hypothetical protein
VDVARIPAVLDCRTVLSSTDVSLIAWLASIGDEQFAMPFEQKSLDYKVSERSTLVGMVCINMCVG